MSDLLLPHTMYLEPSRTMRAPGFEWDHEIQIALPPSYHHTDRAYPVLWVVDGSVLFEVAVGVVHLLTILGDAPEMIVVGVGCPREGVSVEEFSRRREYEFGPNEIVHWEGLGADSTRRYYEAVGHTPGPSGGAPGFLDFLVDDVRPALSADFRMDPHDHGIFGDSHGGGFVGYALFARLGGFAKYICGSPALNIGNFEIFKMEERYAAEHDDMEANVFFGAGDVEINDVRQAGVSVVGSMVRMAETLRLRGYRSLQLTSRIFRYETHLSALPLILSWGVRTLWADVIQAMGLSPALFIPTAEPSTPPPTGSNKASGFEAELR